MAKLTNEQRIEMYEKWKAGYSMPILSLEYGIRLSGVKYLIRLIDKHGIEILRNGKNRRHSPSEKKRMVLRVLEAGESIIGVSVDEGILGKNTLSSWIKSYIENGYNVVERKRGRHAKKERSKKCGRTAEGNRRVKTAEPALNSRERIYKKLNALVTERKKKESKK